MCLVDQEADSQEDQADHELDDQLRFHINLNQRSKPILTIARDIKIRPTGAIKPM